MKKISFTEVVELIPPQIILPPCLFFGKEFDFSKIKNNLCSFYIGAYTECSSKFWDFKFFQKNPYQKKSEGAKLFGGGN